MTRAHGAENPQRRHLIRSAAGVAAGRVIARSAAAIATLALAPLHSARGATLVGVRVWPAADYTRVTLEHDSPLQFSYFMVHDAPLRMVVDIEGIDLTPTLKDLVGKIQPDDPYIRLVRIGQNRPKVVRLVLELKVDVKPQVFAVDPVGPYQHRLVLDLFPAVATDPIAALLQPQGAAGPAPPPAAPAAAAVDSKPDPMAATIARAAQAAASVPAPPAATAPASASQATASDAALPNSNALQAEPVQPAAPAPSAPPAASASTHNRIARILTIAIDPGHGGEDPGAVGRRGTFEKMVTLSIGQRLAGLIEEQPGLRVLLTRDGDYFVPLGTRVDKARRVQADLFVSIHADAWIRPTARGSSVFALSERGASSSAAAWLARHENEADQIGGVNLGAHDENVARVLLDLSTTAQINDSLRFGAAVLHELQRVNRLHKEQVEQAGFAVLKAPDIPSILVETAFISNPDEELRLQEDGYQQQMASAIVNGITHYFARHPPLPRNAFG